jgi:hypothetical protein
VASLEAQTDKDYEHLVWVDSHPGDMFRMYQALPRLARAARGHYIHILDDDDWMVPEFVARVKGVLRGDTPDYFFTHYERIYTPTDISRIPKQDLIYSPLMGAVTHANINLKPELYVKYADKGNGYKDDKDEWVYAGDYWLIKRLWDGGLRPIDMNFVGSRGDVPGLGRSEIYLLPQGEPCAC